MSIVDVGEFEKSLKDELAVSERCLEELRKAQRRLSNAPDGWRFEIFDFGLRLGIGSEKTTERKLERATRACIWLAIALKCEFRVKLIYTIDGYLSAAKEKNPISLLLLARNLLELAATLSAIDSKLKKWIDLDLRDWKDRATMFFAVLYRARHSTSDEKHKSYFAKQGIPVRLFHPFRMKNAIETLASRPGFKWAKSEYHSLSNMCHHNGSGHIIIAEGGRMTNAIVTPNGRAFFLDEEVAAVTLAYPASRFARQTLARTARVAWWSAHCANELLGDMRESPFTDKELRRLTNGQLTNRQCYISMELGASELVRRKAMKIGRNDPMSLRIGKEI
jgi:hypothetical protein